MKENGKLSVCLDPRPVNMVLERKHLQLPVFEGWSGSMPIRGQCTVDYLSNLWEIDHFCSTDAMTVITILKNHFLRYGIPEQVVTDNGS